VAALQLCSSAIARQANGGDNRRKPYQQITRENALITSYFWAENPQESAIFAW
jgi:hypothetical protein